MAKIPEFERRQLASSVVGTPGEDRSGQMVFNAVADTANKVTATGIQLYQEREKAKNDTIVAKSQIDFMGEIEKATIAHEKEFATFKGDPSERQKVYEDRVRTLFNTRLNSMPTNASKVRFEREGYQMVGKALMRETERASAQQSLVAREDTFQGLNELAGFAAEMGANTQIPLATKLGQIQTYQALAANLVNASAKNLTPQDKAKLEADAPVMVLRGFAASAVINSPHELLQAIDDGKFDQLDPKEVTELRKNSIESMKNLEERGRQNALFSSQETNFEIFDKLAKGDPTALIDLENLPDTANNRTLKQIALNQGVKYTTDAFAAAEVMNLFSSLKIDKENPDEADSTLEQLVAATVRIDELVAERRLTLADGNEYKKKIARPILKQIQDDTGGIGQNAWVEGFRAIFNGPGGVGMSFTGKKADKNPDKVKESMAIFNDFKAILNQQKDINAGTIASAISQAKRINLNRKHQELTEVTADVTDAMNRYGKLTSGGTPGSAVKKPKTAAPDPGKVVIRRRDGKLFNVDKAKVKKFIDAGYEVQG